MANYTRILFPVSLTEMSPIVAPHVINMAEKFEADIHLVHVVRKLNHYADSYISQPTKTDIKRHTSNFENQRLATAEEQLAAFKKKYLSNHPTARVYVTSGIQHKKIKEYIEDHTIDLIIMGRGRNIQTNLFGSIADKVAKIAPCPVLLIKTT